MKTKKLTKLETSLGKKLEQAEKDLSKARYALVSLQKEVEGVRDKLLHREQLKGQVEAMSEELWNLRMLMRAHFDIPVDTKDRVGCKSFQTIGQSGAGRDFVFHRYEV